MIEKTLSHSSQLGYPPPRSIRQSNQLRQSSFLAIEHYMHLDISSINEDAQFHGTHIQIHGIDYRVRSPQVRQQWGRRQDI